MTRRSQVVRTRDNAGVSATRELTSTSLPPNAALFGQALLATNDRATPPEPAGMFQTDSIADYVIVEDSRFAVKQPCALSITMEAQFEVRVASDGRGEDGELLGGFTVIENDTNGGQRINGDLRWNEYPNGAWRRTAFPSPAQAWGGICSHAVVHFNICDYDSGNYYWVIPDIYQDLGYDLLIQWKCSVVLMELGTLTWFNPPT